MSFASLLIDSCTVERFTEGIADDYGRLAKTWTSHLIDEPCRLGDTGGREVTVGAEVVIANFKLFTEDIDITEQDRVIIDEITYEILSVLRRKDGIESHHKELLMRAVR